MSPWRQDSERDGVCVDLRLALISKCQQHRCVPASALHQRQRRPGRPAARAKQRARLGARAPPCPRGTGIPLTPGQCWRCHFAIVTAASPGLQPPRGLSRPLAAPRASINRRGRLGRKMRAPWPLAWPLGLGCHADQAPAEDLEDDKPERSAKQKSAAVSVLRREKRRLGEIKGFVVRTDVMPVAVAARRLDQTSLLPAPSPALSPRGYVASLQNRSFRGPGGFGR